MHFEIARRHVVYSLTRPAFFCSSVGSTFLHDLPADYFGIKLDGFVEILGAGQQCLIPLISNTVSSLKECFGGLYAIAARRIVKSSSTER